MDPTAQTPAPKSKPMRGSCLCGKVTLQLSYVEENGLCHCTVCRRLTGSLAKPYLGVPPEHFRQEGESQVYTRHDGRSGKAVENHFCGTCGAQLYSINSLSTNRYVNAGIFPAGSIPPPQAEIYTASMDKWEKLHPGVKVMSGSSDS